MSFAYKKLEKSNGKLDIKIKNNKLLKLLQQGSLKALLPNFHENLNSNFTLLLDCDVIFAHNTITNMINTMINDQ